MPTGAIHKAVVDSGPLFTALALQFSNNFLQQKRHELMKHVIADPSIRHNQSRQNAYLTLFKQIRSPLTTSHVIGEIQGLQTSCMRLTGRHLQMFWSQSLHFLKSLNFDEQLLRLLDMSQRIDLQEAVYKYGPTDIGLIALAQREGCVLLTDDIKTLASHAWKVGIDCRVVSTLV